MVDQEQSLKPQLRITELEALRGFASWWVVLGHLAFVFSDRLGQIIHNRSAVDLFFIISGFVISHLLSRSWRGYPDYIIKRGFRIFPMYALAVLFGAATLGWQIYGVSNPLYGGARAAERIAALTSAQSHLGAHLAAHLTMLHGWVPPNLLPYSDIAILGQGWSISVEWSFYLVAPLTLWALRGRIGGLAVAVGLLAALIALRWVAGLGGNSANLTFAAPWLAAGMVFDFIHERRGRTQGVWTIVFGWGLAAASVAVGLLLRSPGLMVWGVVWPVLFGATAFYAPLLRKAMNWPFMQMLGKISYSTYLIHMYVLYLAMAATRYAGLAAPASALVIVTCCIGVTFLLSFVGYFAVEQRFIRLGQRLARKLQRPVA